MSLLPFCRRSGEEKDEEEGNDSDVALLAKYDAIHYWAYLYSSKSFLGKKTYQNMT